MAVTEVGGRGRAAARHRPLPARPSAIARAGWFPWLPVWLSLGIGLWFAMPFQPGRGSIGLAALAAAAGLLLAIRGGHWAPRVGWWLSDTARLGGLALVVAAAGFALTVLRSEMVEAPVLGWRYYGPVEGRVVEVDRSSRDKLRVTLDRVVLRDLSPDRTPRRVRLSLPEGATPPAPGARVMLTGHLGPPPGPSAPGAFDFRRTAWFQGLGAIGYTRTPVMTAAPPPTGGAQVVHRLRLRLSTGMQAAIGGQAGAVAAALMTGDRSGIAEATNAVMRDSNLYHIVSISGLHMSMLAGFIYTALRMALALAGAAGLGAALPAHKIAAGVALLAAGGYLWLSGGGAAPERAFLMVAVMLIAIIADRRAISLRTVALAALILLALAPEALSEPGFQMSFAATVALILSYEPWQKLAPHVPRWLRPGAMLVISSAVAGVATAPLAAAHFNRMSEYGLLANLLAVPVVGAVVMPAGVIAGLLAPLGLAGPALWLMGLGTRWMLAVAAWVAGLEGSVTAVPAPPAGVMPLLGAGAVTLALAARQGGWLPRRATLLAGLAAILAAALLWWAVPRPLLLIAPEAEAVGLMTRTGRALSKPAGGAFAAATWLTEDGDTATPQEAAARSGWTGPKGDRRAVLPDGTMLRHLTGKGTARGVAAACAEGGIVVAATRASEAAGCRLYDQRELARTGAIAIAPDGRVITVQQLSGLRPWNASSDEVRQRRSDTFAKGGKERPKAGVP